MNISQAVSALAHDDKLIYALILVAVDLVLGVAAALATRQFKLSYIADFARNDILNKLVPWGTLYVAAKFATGSDFLGTAENAVYVIAIAAWVGSIIASLTALGLPIKWPQITRGEHS